jgi:hypothetical protein
MKVFWGWWVAPLGLGVYTVTGRNPPYGRRYGAQPTLRTLGVGIAENFFFLHGFYAA